MIGERLRRRAALSALLVALAGAVHPAEVRLPIGKGTVTPFALDVPDAWAIVPGRTRGDRWLLRDRKSGLQVARIDYKLPSTDQKMQWLAFQKRLRLGTVEVDKVSVTPGPAPDDADEPIRITRSTELVTSYSVAEGPLQGLVVMTEGYRRASGLEARIERMLSSVRLR